MNFRKLFKGENFKINDQNIFHNIYFRQEWTETIERLLQGYNFIITRVFQDTN